MDIFKAFFGVLMFQFLLALIFPSILFSAKIICPARSFVDQEIAIAITDLPLNQEVTLELLFTDRKNNLWNSEATYFSSSKGRVDLKAQSPTSGSYEGVDPMGLFYAMNSCNPRLDKPSLTENKIIYTLNVYGKGKQLSSKTFERYILAPEVEVIPVRERGLNGRLFLPSLEGKQPVVIILPGSSGGFGATRAGLVASNGIATLALAYFGEEGLPSNLEHVSLEYFEETFAYIDNHTRLSGEIYLYGVSRGAELALILAAAFPDRISKTVAALPSSVVFGALNKPNTDAWLLGGKPFAPKAPVPIWRIDPSAGLERSNPLKTADLMSSGKALFPNEWELAAIPVEKIKGPLLLISGEEDGMWHSSMFGVDIMKRLDRKQSKIEREHLSYSDAGHGISYPFIPHSNLYFHPVAKRWFTLGGTQKGDEFASRDSWKKIIDFLGNKNE